MLVKDDNQLIDIITVGDIKEWKMFEDCSVYMHKNNHLNKKVDKVKTSQSSWHFHCFHLIKFNHFLLHRIFQAEAILGPAVVFYNMPRVWRKLFTNLNSKAGEFHLLICMIIKLQKSSLLTVVTIPSSFLCASQHSTAVIYVSYLCTINLSVMCAYNIFNSIFFLNNVYSMYRYI